MCFNDVVYNLLIFCAKMEKMESENNKKIAKIFYEMARFLEMESANFRSRAYDKAGDILENLDQDVSEIYKKDGEAGLEKLSGIGKSMAEKIIEYLKNGKIKKYEDFRKKMPVNFGELLAVEGVGVKVVRDLHKFLKIKNLEDLEKAARAGKIRDLPNFGEKTEQNILKSISFLKRGDDRFLLDELKNDIIFFHQNKIGSDGPSDLVELKDIKGDLHIHSDWDGGEDSILELAEAGIKKGYEYIGISDHTKFVVIERGLDENRLLERNKEIDELNKKFKSKNFRILKGCEANIMEDGSIDIEDAVLAQMDFVIAGVHSSFKLPREEMTARMVVAMRNPNIDIISHPTGRIISKRDEYELDFEKILDVAKETGTVLEINSNPRRLDLKDANIRKAKERGVKMIITTDAHHLDNLEFMEYGVFHARRGGAEKQDIINTLPLEKFLKCLKI